MNESDRDDSPLFELVSQIDEGRQVDWDEAERLATNEHERAIVAALRVLAGVAQVARRPAEPLDLAATSPAAGEPGPLFVRWGPLTLLELIGQGAFGTVFRARDALDREVALKLLSVGRDLAPDAAQRLIGEGRLMARIKHANVVDVYGVDQFDSAVGLWMEFVRGRTLEQELATRGVFGAEEATPIAKTLCRALAAVHAEGLLHRDIKAQNVMREAGGRILLMDFGTGHDMRASAPGATIALAGTPLYLAPELFDRGSATVVSDVYSLGVLIFHLVTRRYPFEGATRSEIEESHRQHRRLRLRDVRPDLPDAFIEVVERAIATSSRDRYQSAGELGDALAASSNTTPPVPESNPAPASSPTRRAAPPAPNRGLTLGGRWFGIAAAAAAVIAALAIGLTYFVRPASHGFSPTAGAADALVEPRTAPAATPAANEQYSVQATFLRVLNEADVPVASGDRVGVGDRLALGVATSTAAHVYVVTSDEHGDLRVLFPLPGQALRNPLPAGVQHRLPDRKWSWQVTTPGGKERFLVYVSPTQLFDLESFLRTLPAPREGEPLVASPVLPSSLVGRLRGIGGLVETPHPTGTAANRPPSIFSDSVKALTPERETTSGVWVRQMVLTNPPR